MLAVVGCFDDVAGMLLSYGARVDETEDELHNVLNLAVLHRRLDLLKTLFGHVQKAGNTAVTNAYNLRG